MRVEALVGSDHIRHQPGAAVFVSGFRAGLNDGVEVPVHGRTEPASAQRFMQASGDAEPVRNEHGPGVGRPPEDGVAVAEPGEDPAPIGVDQAGRAQSLRPRRGVRRARSPPCPRPGKGARGSFGVEEVKHQSPCAGSCSRPCLLSVRTAGLHLEPSSPPYLPLRGRGSADGGAETLVRDPMRGPGAGGKEAAADLVLTLGAGLEALQAALRCNSRDPGSSRPRSAGCGSPRSSPSGDRKGCARRSD